MTANKPGSMGFYLLIGLILLSAACSQQAVPTPLPVAVVPTIAPSPTSLPATLDLTAMAAVPAQTAAVATATLPPASAATDAATATPIPIRPSINIAVPDANAVIILGSDIVARGLAKLDSSQTAWLSLVSLDGQLLAETQAVTQDGGWESSITVPEFISGVAMLTATIRGADGQVMAEHVVPIHLALDAEKSDRYLALFRPVSGDKAMAGFNLFFDGRAQRPVNNTVTISVRNEGCQTQVARQSFVLRGSGYWQGFVIVPNSVSGPGCAIAHFGTPGDENWREAQIPIEIWANDASGAGGVTIGNPPPGSSLTAGQEYLLYGTALSASEAPIEVTILLENGRIVSQNTAFTDFWGYWEMPVILPVDVEGPASITATAGEPGDDGFAESQTLVTIRPAPTPSP